MRRDRKRLRNWLLLCLLLAGLITLTVKRMEKGTGWQKISSVEENEQAIFVDGAENLSMDTEQRTGEEWLPDLLLTELGESFGPEVWKVQSVLARTWLWNLANEHDKAGDSWEKSLFSLEELQEAGWTGTGQEWASADAAVQRLCKEAIRVSDGYVLLQKDTAMGGQFPPLFHLCSAGQTRDGGSEYAGLCAVDSKTDLLLTEAVKVQFVTAEEFQTAMSDILKETVSAEEATVENLSCEKDSSGYVTKLIWKRADGKEQMLDPEAFRKRFALASPWFELAAVDGQIRLTGRGIGHGYGLSHYGAAAMEQEGKTWREILSYYFPNAELGQK